MWIFLCLLPNGLLAIERVETGEYLVVTGWDNIANGKLPTESELAEIRYHKRYLRQIYGR